MREIFISLNFFVQVFPLIHKNIFKYCSISIILVMLFLSGCSPIVQKSSGLQQTPYFRPPDAGEKITTPGAETLASVPTNPGISSTEQSQPAESAQCKDSLVFVKDLTIPDGTVIAPESTLDKRWEITNNSNCNWGEGYRVRLIAGPELGAQKEQALYPARSGTQAVIRILFKAPVEPGSYRSAWQAFNAQGEPFGDPFFIDIVVSSPE